MAPEGSRQGTARTLPFPWAPAALAVAVWTLLRLGLFFLTGPSQAGWGHLPLALLKGLWFDLATAAWIAAPFLLVHALVPGRWRATRLWGALRLAALWGCAAFLIFGAVAEVVFWQEFSTRFNFIAVDYLIYTQEVVANIRQSYPMGWIFGGIGAAALAIVLLVRRCVRFSAAPLGSRARLASLALAFLLPAASLGLASLDQMDGSGNAYADELGGNGVYAFFAAFRRNGLDYDRFYRTLPQADCDRVLAGLGVRRKPLEAGGAAAPDAPPEAALILGKPRNVVLVSVESLSASFLGCYGDKRGLTPELDRLAAGGLRYTNLFATGTRTVRGLEALSLGTPPIPGQAIVRRPGNEGLGTVGGFLAQQGYRAIFLYGGYGYFDNMNAYFAGNGYRILDRSDFPKAEGQFANAWGVADETLYANALAAMDRAQAEGAPFFAHIMTTSNHRPYTYPDGRIDIPSPGGRDGAVKYTDWAIGRFIEAARAKPWFKDTLFVLVADHCASAAGKTALPVEGFRIPLILYAPALVKPGVDSRLCSQMDLPPTILDLVDAPGEASFFGRSLFKAQASAPRAFIANYQDLGYYKDGLLTVLKPKQGVEAFRVDPDTFAETPAPVDPALLEEAIAYYETGTHAFDQGALKISQ